MTARAEAAPPAGGALGAAGLRSPPPPRRRRRAPPSHSAPKRRLPRHWMGAPGAEVAASRFRFRGEGGLPARPGEGKGKAGGPAPLYKMAEVPGPGRGGSPGQKAATGSPRAAPPCPRALKLVIKATCATPRRF